MPDPGNELLRGEGPHSATYVCFGVTGEGERPPFAMAGVWRTYRRNYGCGDLREMMTSSIITTTPNALVQDTHPDRMPMILAPENYTQWQTGTPDEAFDLIKPFPAEQKVIHQSGEGLKSDHGGLDTASQRLLQSAFSHDCGSSRSSVRQDMMTCADA